jgi:hypothetical protein
MGLLSDFVLATEADIQTCTEDDLHTRFPIMYCTRIDPLNLATLEYVLIGTDFGPLLEKVDHTFVREFGQEGWWVYPVRRELTAALEALPPAQIDAVAQAWAATAETEKWSSLRDSVEGFSLFLHELIALLHEWRSSDERLYLCMSL